jgi:hypothetical protein
MSVLPLEELMRRWTRYVCYIQRRNCRAVVACTVPRATHCSGHNDNLTAASYHFTTIIIQKLGLLEIYLR